MFYKAYSLLINARNSRQNYMIETETNVTENLIPDDGIGMRIKSARESKKLSQVDVHKKTGLSRTVLINYEAGRHKPGAKELKLICDALQVSPNFLIYGTEQPYAIDNGLAKSLLTMGPAALPSLIILIPMISAFLDHDEKRVILELIDTLIKAKSPEVYADLMTVLKAIPKADEVDFKSLHPNENATPETMKMFKKTILDKLDKIPKKS